MSLPWHARVSAAFDDAMAAWDVRGDRLVWHNPAFVNMVGAQVVAGGGLRSDIDRALPGLIGSLDALRIEAQDGHKAWIPIQSGDTGVAARSWMVEVAWDAPEACWMLRVTDDHARARQVQRHLQDREQMLFTSRILSVGEMATTLAHEINQPLGTITNVLHGLQRRLTPTPGRSLNADDLMQGVEFALAQAHFASRIIARIRDYTASRQPSRETFLLPKLLRESLSLLDWEIQHLSVTSGLHLEIPTPQAWVAGDWVMLQQVLVNLMRNAIDAMQDSQPTARHLTVSLTHQPALTRGLRPEWIVRISDTGSGMSDETERKLFTPFASSKPNGMGIGLNICRSFIEMHDGRLWFTRNEPRAGCTFHVALPVIEEGSHA